MAQESGILTPKREEAAALVAEGDLTEELIAARLNIGRRTLVRWKADPAFEARVQETRQEYARRILARGIALRERRVEALQDRWERMRRVIEARAEAMPDDAPGTDTGLLVHQVKVVGQGKSAQVVDEYAVDVGLLRELREHEKQAAQELGQWQERTQHSGTVQHVATVTLKLSERGDDGRSDDELDTAQHHLRPPLALPEAE